ncbi:MAG: heme-binding protein [Pseudomonadota bacterium]|nr:heme-binding protein [Pseudomonadota bacterium]
MITKHALTLDDAKQLMEAAEGEARRNGWEVVIAIVNDGGRIVTVHRMDGARPGNDEITLAKANTSAMTCRPSAVWERWIETNQAAYATFPFLAAQGGLPIIIDGELVGAMGISGVKSFEDEQIALHAIQTVFPLAATARAGKENDGTAV